MSNNNAHGKFTTREDYAVGSTLNISLNPCPSPFSDDSFKKFVEAFAAKSQANPDQQGTFKMLVTLAQDQSSKSKALGVDGKLDFSYGPVSGDANVKFAMNNIQGSLQLTMVVHAQQTGRVVKNGLDEVVDLKLRETVVKAISEGLTFEEFKQQFGEYLVIGFEYGGQVLFNSTYSTKSSDDKMSVAGGLSLSYGKMGFNIKGSVDGDYKSEDMSKSTNITTQYSIFPSFDDELINGDDGIIPLLKKISDPTSNGLKADGDKDDEKEFGTLAQKIDQKIQRLLGGKKLDKVNCIILPIKAIGCVNDAFIKEISVAPDVQAFLKFANLLYMKMQEILKGLEVVNNNYDEHDPDHKPKKLIDLWLESTSKSIKFMNSINGKKIYKFSKLYAETVDDSFKINKRPKDDASDDEKDESSEIEKEFYKMDRIILEKQFNEQIMIPYDKMMAMKGNNSSGYDPAKSCKIALKAVSGKMLSAQPKGEILANRDHTKEWETFESIPCGDNKVVLKTHHGTYVSVKTGLVGKGKVKAEKLNKKDDKKHDFKDNEKFEVMPQKDGKVAFRAADGKFLSAHTDNKACDAKADKIGDWQQFTITIINH